MTEKALQITTDNLPLVKRMLGERFGLTDDDEYFFDDEYTVGRYLFQEGNFRPILLDSAVFHEHFAFVVGNGDLTRFREVRHV